MNISIVTGASSGMGREFAKCLDCEKLDEIWIISRNLEQLNNLKNELKTKTRVFDIDLSNLKEIDLIEDCLKENNANVLWLINAAGFGKFDNYENIGLDTHFNMIDLNINSVLKMIDICLPFMKENARIVNFASLAAFQPVPYGNVYSATKSFILQYSRALNFELKSRKISVIAVCPYWTKTKFFDRAMNKKNQVVKKYMVMYDPKKVVNKAYKNAIKRKSISIYGFVANMQVFFTKIFPASWISKIWLKQNKINYKKK